jgi:hypothetical protein
LDVPRPAKVHFVNCLAAVLLAGLLGCSKHALKTASGPDAAVPVSDAMAADVSNDPVDFGGSGTATDTIIDNLEAGVAAQDAGAAIGTGIDAGVPDAGVVDAGALDAPADAPPDGDSTPDAERRLDACVPLACSNYATCVGDYCGTIGDGCGGTLNCPTKCPGNGWVCEDSVCKGSVFCLASTCFTANGNQYCGDIYDGCGGTVHCGACAKAGWICQNGLCIGPPSVCKPTTCDGPNGEGYCGTICNACGGSIDCGTTCPKSGWFCVDGSCKGGPSCPRLTCNPTGGQYCGAIGDGCGGTIDCGRQCSDGSTCGERVTGVCGSSSDISAPPPPPPPPLPAIPLSCGQPPPIPCPPPPPPP